MSFTTIKPQIKTILDGIADIGVTYLFDKGRLEKYPAAVIYPSENANDFETTSQNLTTYVFTVRLHYPMEEAGGDTHEKADRILGEVIDQVIDAFDKRDNLTLGGTAKFIRATPSIWGYQTRETGILRTAEVRLECVTLRSVV